jgi:hypothetical protein
MNALRHVPDENTRGQRTGSAAWRKFLSAVVGIATAHLLVLSSALAHEVWIAPAKNAADTEIGNWAVSQIRGGTRQDQTHFVFHTPPDRVRRWGSGFDILTICNDLD